MIENIKIKSNTFQIIPFNEDDGPTTLFKIESILKWGLVYANVKDRYSELDEKLLYRCHH